MLAKQKGKVEIHKKKWGTRSGGGNERNISACACVTPTMQQSFVFLGRNNHVFHRFEMDFYHLFMIFEVSHLLYSQAQLLLKLCVC